MRASCFFTALCIIACMPSSTALADEAGARAAKDRADALEKEGKLEESCTLREQVDLEAPNFRRKWALGICNEKLGKTATAWLKYDAALQFARTQLQLKPNDMEAKAQEQQAKPKVDEIAKRVPKVHISVPERTPGMTVLRASEPVPESLFDTNIAVDPGDITVTASAPGFVSFSTTITVKESSIVPVTVPALGCEGDKHRVGSGCEVCAANESWTGKACECAQNFERVGGKCVVACMQGEVRDEASNSCHPACVGHTTWNGTECIAIARTDVVPPAPPRSSHGIPTLTWVFGGAGAVSLVGSGVFTGLASWKWGRSKVNGCDSATKICTTKLGTDEQHDAQTFGNVATVMLIGGVILVGVGVTIWATSGSGNNDAAPKTSLVLQPNGFQIAGSF